MFVLRQYKLLKILASRAQNKEIKDRKLSNDHHDESLGARIRENCAGLC